MDHKCDEPSEFTHARIQRYYDEVYYKDAAAAPTVTGHLHRLARRLDIAPGTRVLDVACGTGAWLRAAQERGAVVAGIDLSKRAIELCHAQMPEGEFHVGAAERLPFRDEQFDLVTCLGSLEHFLDPVAALKEMRRVARAKARFLILVPNSGFLTRRLGLYRGTWQRTVIEQARSLDEWQGIFRDAGLQVTERWKDLHVLSWSWIRRGPWYQIPIRLAQALLLPIWPLSWQYQVYHLCVEADDSHGAC